jgi:hypothetical protein
VRGGDGGVREELAARKLAAAGAVSGLGAGRPWNGHRSGRSGLRCPLAVLAQAVTRDRACRITAGRRGRGTGLGRRLRNGQQGLGERKRRQRGRDDDGGKLRHALLIGPRAEDASLFLRDALIAAINAALDAAAVAWRASRGFSHGAETHRASEQMAAQSLTAGCGSRPKRRDASA